MGKDTFVGRIGRGAGQILAAQVNFGSDVISGKNVFDSFGKLGANVLSGGLNVTGVSQGFAALDKSVGKIPVLGNITGLGTNALEIQKSGVNRSVGVKFARNLAVTGAVVGAGFGASALLAPGASIGAVGASSAAAVGETAASVGGASFLGTVGTTAAAAGVGGLVTGLINKGQRAIGDFISNLGPSGGGDSPTRIVEQVADATPYGGYESIPYKGPVAPQPKKLSTMTLAIVVAAVVAGYIYYKRKH